jgi:Xaa-Pro dipeptidase
MREEKQDMHKQRLSQLIKLAKAQKLDAVAVVPGPNQFYLTGLSFHLSERPIVAIFRVDKTPAIVMPSFEAVRLEDAPFEMDTFTYTDEEGYLPAFQRAYAELALPMVSWQNSACTRTRTNWRRCGAPSPSPKLR